MPTKIDDRDSSITYTGSGWTNGGMNREYQSTVKYSTTAGDSFHVDFTGTQIAVYGTLDSTSQGVITTYSIDGQSAESVTSPKVSGDTYQQKFWESDTLSSGNHTLDVILQKVMPVGQVGEGTVWFDYFDIAHGGSTSSDVGTATSPAGDTTTGTRTKSATSTGTSIATTTNSKSSNTGAVVGGVIAAVLVILALTAAFLLYRNRKRRDIQTSDSFEKFFNNAPHTGAAAQNTIGPPAASPFSAPNAPADVPRPGPGYPVASPQAAPFSPYNPYATSNVASTVTAPPNAFPSAYAPSTTGLHSSRPSLDATSVTSSSAVPPSKQFLYTHNSDNVLAYTAPGPSSSTPPSVDGDSIAELKRRQQEAVANYNQGLQGGQVVQHVDSGIRTVDPVVDVPPVYTAN